MSLRVFSRKNRILNKNIYELVFFRFQNELFRSFSQFETPVFGSFLSDFSTPTVNIFISNKI